MNFRLPQPQIFGQKVFDEFLKTSGKIPDYVSSLIRSPMRKFPVDKIFGDQVERFVGVVEAMVLWLCTVEGSNLATATSSFLVNVTS